MRPALLIATHNQHKTEEFRQILGEFLDVMSLSEVPHSEPPEETGVTFEQNASLKAVAASTQFKGWVIADDSGLEVDALGGAPGVHSARYSGAQATDAGNRQKLLGQLGEVPVQDRTARFRCVIAVARNGVVFETFSGSVEGVIIETERGAGGFGYDPLFVPRGYEETFAEMDPEEKNALSHRGRAAKQAVEWLLAQTIGD